MALENHLQEEESKKRSAASKKELSDEFTFFIRTALRILLFVLFMMAIDFCFGQTSGDMSVIKGTVTDHKKQSLEFVHVYLQGTTTGNVTNSRGYFEIKTDLIGDYTLVTSLVGFIPSRKEIQIQPGDTLIFDIELKEELLDLENVNITASSFTTGEVDGVTLSPMEVVTTPGAAADIFRAFQSFPGVSSIDEGSGLFVRGGDATETKILLDQATVVHPYKYETPTGGVFGTIPPFLVSGTFFSTGGFPARYGNALSGVLAMKSEGLPDRNTTTFNLGLAAASAGLSSQLIPEKLGVNFSANQSFTETMFRVNGQADEFSKAPSSTDLNLNLIYKPDPSSTIKAFSYLTKNKIGVAVDEPSFAGNYTGDESNQLYNLQWTRLLGSDWLMENSLSMNRFEKTSSLGILALRSADETYKFRSDWEKQFSETIKLYTGAEVVNHRNSFEGTIPREQEILDPEADFYQLNEEYDANRLGVYAEMDLNPAYRWLVNIGLRSDYHDLADEATIDPRISVRYQLSKQSNIRASAGIYHQFPEAFQFNSESGNPDLGAQQSVHYILGFEHEQELIHFRAEAYYKDYDQLVIPDNSRNLSNRGYGNAYGADVFLRYSRFLQSRFNGWISYSILNSERYQARSSGEAYFFEEAPSGFDITHNLSVVGKYRIIGMFYGGMSFRYATGRPFTPITDAWQSENQDYYVPVEGAVNSRRLPAFQRMDINLSYYWPLPDNQSITFYLSVSNAMNRENITDYTYNQDYTQRSPVYSNYNRFMYAGVTANLNL